MVSVSWPAAWWRRWWHLGHQVGPIGVTRFRQLGFVASPPRVPFAAQPRLDILGRADQPRIGGNSAALRARRMASRSTYGWTQTRRNTSTAGRARTVVGVAGA